MSIFASMPRHLPLQLAIHNFNTIHIFLCWAAYIVFLKRNTCVSNIPRPVLTVSPSNGEADVGSDHVHVVATVPLKLRNTKEKNKSTVIGDR